MAITHPFVSSKSDDADATLVRPTNWNADHTIADGTITAAQLAFDPATQTELDISEAMHLEDAASTAEKFSEHIFAGPNIAITEGLGGDAVTITGSAGSTESMLEFDDFINATSVSSDFTKFRYLTGSTFSQIAAELNHPGIIRLSSTGGNSLNLSYLDSLAYLPADNFIMTFIIRPNSHTNSDYSVGSRAILAHPPVDGIFVEALTTDTNWFLVTRAASTQTRVDTGVPIVSTNWFKIVIRRVSASVIGAAVNAAAEVTSATNIPTPAQNIYLDLNVSSGTQTLDIDYWSLGVVITQRYT